MGRISFLVSLALLVLVLVPVWGSTWYVDDSVASSGDGKSLETAFKKIQEGIDAASDGDTVIVAEGTYVENILFDGKNIVLCSTDPIDPQVVAATVIDGNQAGSVVTFAGTEDEGCALSGFTIRNGSAAQSGGGICGGSSEDATRATIRSNTITGNLAAWHGGGVAYCDGAVCNNTITGNSASLSGGGLNWCNGAVHNNAVCGNSAGGDGGGLHHCQGTIGNNTITANLAGSCGGAMEWCNGTIQNNKITGNSARSGGGLSECNGIIESNTITGNSAHGLTSCGAVIRNCIIWGNSGLPSLQFSNTPTFSCIEGWTGWGPGNITGDPRFLDGPGGDYRLGPGSPCIDAGANSYWPAWPQQDLDGNCRLSGTRVDIGCYEYASSPDSDGDLLPDAEELARGSNPNLDDTDGDGLRDGLEMLRGTNPCAATPPGAMHVPGDFATIQQSLALALKGDEIIVAPGTYYENIEFRGTDVILRGSDPGNAAVVTKTVIDGRAAGPVVRLTGMETKSCVISGFTIRNGWALNGGGILGSGSNATIQNNLITGNSAELNGGGIAGCGGIIQCNTIQDNCAYFGGGVSGCQGTIRNNLVRGNSAIGELADAGGIGACNGVIVNNTIVENSAQQSGGGVAGCYGVILNCIISSNSASTGHQVFRSQTPIFSCIDGWTGGGEGNISDHPRFAAGSYRLSEASPCIDAAKNEDWMWTAVDLDGNPRIFYGKKSLTVDMGAYECGSWPFKLLEMEAPEGGPAFLTWKSRVGDTYTVWSCDDLSTGAWVEEASVASQGASTSWTDVSPVGQQKFYRIEIK